MGMMVLQERACWLTLTTLSSEEKEDLFDEAVTVMQKRCEERKQGEQNPEAVSAEKRTLLPLWSNCVCQNGVGSNSDFQYPKAA